jgi:hypothetical protein
MTDDLDKTRNQGSLQSDTQNQGSESAIPAPKMSTASSPARDGMSKPISSKIAIKVKDRRPSLRA